ncbi:MAG TPA: hypothetical protein V6C97_21605 [Oculatellaceae cyanobacterium]
MNQEYASIDPMPLQGRAIQLSPGFPPYTPAVTTMADVFGYLRRHLCLATNTPIPMLGWPDPPPVELINMARCWMRVRNLIIRFDHEAHQGLAQGGEAFRPQIASSLDDMRGILRSLMIEIFDIMSSLVDGPVVVRWLRSMYMDIRNDVNIVSYRYDDMSSLDMVFMELGCVFICGVDVNKFNPFTCFDLLSTFVRV